MYRQQGFALVVVLAFLLITMLLGVLAMDDSLLEQRMTVQFMQKIRVQLAAEDLLSQLPRQYSVLCLKSMSSTDEVKLLLSQLRDSDTPCKGVFGDFKYYYVVEALPKAESSRRYFRLSVRVESKIARMSLQTTLVQDDNNHSMHRVAWRELEEV